MQLDLLVLAPHPDDAELHCGGVILAAREAGYSVGIVDLTAGELSTRGSSETRAAERDRASAILGLDLRECAGLPDGHLSDQPEQVARLVEILRRLRPQTVLYPSLEDRHPDHEAAGRLCERALFMAGLVKYLVSDTDSVAPHRPSRAIRYLMHQERVPDFVIDISAQINKKLQAIRAYGSQFTGTESPASEINTYISDPAFLESLLGRWKRWGFLIGVEYAEGFTEKELTPMPLAGLFTPDRR